MGLRSALRRTAAAAPHVLLVPVPGQAALRWAAERWLDDRGWPLAQSPADADVLLECGEPGPELSQRAGVAWEAMPGPRTRVRLLAADRVGAVLPDAQVRLADLGAQRAEAASRTAPAPSAEQRDDGDVDHGDMDMGGMDHGDMDMGGMDHGGMDMGGMDMGGMDMSLPGGLVMADRVEDRDGLRLEGLALRWGPLLPGWPAGLELDVVLSGDVLTTVGVRQLDAGPEPADQPAGQALDALALVLAASGWHDGAVRARRARDEGGSGPLTEDILRRLGSARVLRWSLRELPGPAGRSLVEHLDLLIAVARGEPRPDDAPTAVDALGAALTGLELGSASVVVAAFGPTLRQATIDA